MAKTINAWGLKKCSTCQDALKWLDAKSVEVNFTDYSVEKPTKAQIKKWIKGVGGWEKLINRAGYTWKGLPEEDKQDVTEEKAIILAQNHTSLIRRPLIEHQDGSITVGFKPKVQELF
ncbi:MAG: Spx/MgsR family RNA polymerase-binding regulatory protein [Alphaproteobacteria bacterium]|nr:Spx/MgsR family RNA polymerase-binding regulatory protein [Alphaproteobacteria bacterium]